MSDFDKEAEREKLREKYGDEGEDRETTQQMSELLLQGATMTNRHCDECGDPIFRHEGQEFCPTCQSAGGAAAGEAGTQSGDAAARPENAATRPADGDRRGGDGATPRTEPEAEADGREATPETPTPDAATTPPSPQGGRSRDPQGERARPRSERSGTGGDDLPEAQRSLARTIARFARNAEEAEDPRAAKEHLAAAREAAEALSALRP
jgi:uncharacterized Zn finger protein (UPF0148 family)